MVAPVIGPVSILSNTPAYYVKKTLYSQKKPFNLPLAYAMQKRRRLAEYKVNTAAVTAQANMGNNVTGDGAWPFFYGQGWAPGEGLCSSALGVARSRFISEMRGDTAMNAVNLLEMRQSMGMIEKRAIQLFQFSNAIRKFQFQKAARILGVVEDFKKKQSMGKMILHKRKDQFANNWLEYSFGWKPLIMDMKANVDILQSDVPSGHIKGHKKYTSDYKVIQQNTQYQLTYYTHIITAKAIVWAEIKITNPNLYLANKLGFVDPAGVIWEAIPFSFVVDWFVNVSDFLGSFSESFGVEVTNAYYSVGTADLFVYDSRYHGPKSVQRVEALTRSSKRVLGIPAVKLAFHRPWEVKPARAANAISLLIQKGLKR